MSHWILNEAGSILQVPMPPYLIERRYEIQEGKNHKDPSHDDPAAAAA